MNYRTTFKKLLLPSLISALALPALPAFAQESYLEEVIVSARKRLETVQDIPLAVTAITPGQLERGSITTSIDVAKLVPNVVFSEAGIGSQSLSASIRGLAYDDIEKSIEPTVGISIDGVFLASNSGGVFDFFDVQSVEVLRGPQGTLFGRNTIGGVISVERTEPTGEFGGKVEATVGEEDLVNLKGLFNMPLGEKGGLKVVVTDIESKSPVYNTTLKKRRDYRDSQTLTLAAKYDFTDDITAILTYDDYDHDTTAPDNLFQATGVLESIGFNEGYEASEADDWKTSPQLLPLTATLEGENITLKVTQDADNYTLKYIGGIMDYDEQVNEASWGTPGIFFPVDRAQEFKQTSHEFQYISNLDGAIDFVVGLYYMKAESFITSGPVVNFTAEHELTTLAAFSEITYNFDDVWSLTAGARYTEEDKDLDSRSFVSEAARLADSTDPADLTNSGSPSFEDDNVSYRLILQRDFEKGMVFASIATGFRSGGFFNRGSTDAELAPFDSEEVTSYELGLRSNPTADSQLNITYFMTDYSDKQTTVITAASDPACGKGGAAEDAAGITCSFVRNAGEVSFSGVEIEGVWAPTEALNFRAAVGTLDGEYDEFDYNGVDISDQAELIYAPDLTASLVAEHYSELAGGELTITAGFTYRDEVYTQADWSTYDPETGPNVVIESFETLDISANYRKDLGNGTLTLRAYGNDVLEDGNRIQRRFDAGSFAWAEPTARRQFGVSVGYEF